MTDEENRIDEEVEDMDLDESSVDSDDEMVQVEKKEDAVQVQESFGARFPEEKGVINTEVTVEMKKSYLDYAMSVIVSRAIPSIEDGMKPVQRRILYAMQQLGLKPSAQTKKSARVVGDVIGKYHPHGDSSVYEAMVRMAQDFSLRYPLVFGQGNFGSIDGDSAAAYRYCVAGDTLILTDKGMLPISEISSKKEASINMKILSYEGKKNSASKFFNSGKHKTIKILTKTGYYLEGSYNHPVLVWSIGIDFKPKILWKLLEELKEGDVVVLNRNYDLFSKNVFDLKNHYPKKGFKNNIQLPSKMNNDLAFLLGALVSEGSFHNKQILFNNKDKEFYNKIKSIILSQFNGVQLYEREIRGGCVELSIYEQKVVMFLQNIGLKSVKSHEKEIPFSVLRSKKEHVKNFLIALFEGDGSVQNIIDKRHGGKSIQLCYDSKSEILIKQIKNVLMNFGVVSNNPQKDKRNGCLKLYFSSHENINRFYQEIGFFSKRKQGLLKSIKILNSTRLSKTDFIPFLNDYLRMKYDSQFILKNNFDRYNSLIKNYGSLMKIINKQDKIMIDWILKNRFYFDQLINVEKTKKPRTVYSVKVNSGCHSFVANCFVNHNTEAKMEKIAAELLEDLDKDTVEFTPNFDGSMKEPALLPGKVPALILNGATGIAVGMATNIPPHNLREIADAIILYVDNPEITVEELVKEAVQGPDFPTGGMVQGDMIELYKTGRGKMMMRGKTNVEESSKKDSVVISEIPYMVNKATLVTQIANLVRDKKLKDISDLRDESSKGKIRIVIELKKGVDSQFVINALYKYTRLQDSFNVNFLALVEGKPKILGLRDVLENYVRHRKSIITKRTEYDLNKAQLRQEIVDGLLKALDSIDQIIKVIRFGKNPSEELKVKFKFTENQVKAILETKLRQLTALEHDKLKGELKELEKNIKEYQKILGDIKEVLNIIKKEVKELKENYGDPRRTQVFKRSFSEISEKDLVQEKEVVVSITDKGYVKRMDIQTYKEQKRGGKGVIGSGLATGDFTKQILTCSTHDYLMFFTTRGRVLWLKTYDLPEAERYGKGKALVNLLGLKEEQVTSVISVKNFDDYLIMATKKGIVKRIALSHFSKPRVSGVKAINLPLDNSDDLIGVEIVKENQEINLATKDGKAIRFDVKAVRSMGRTSYGVTGIKMSSSDEVVSLEVLDTQAIFTITNKGYGKRTAVEDYRKTSRAGKGVINLKVNDKTGKVVNAISVNDDDSIIITTAKGMVIRTSLENIRVMGRATQGVRVVKLQEGDKVTDVIRVVDVE